MSLLQHGAVQSHFLIFFLHLFNWFSTNLKIRKITKKNLNLICLHHSSPFNVFCAFLFLLLSSYIPRSCPGFGSMVVAMSLKRAYIDSRHLSYSQYFNFLLLCYPTILLPIVTAPAIYSIHPLLPPSCILLGKQNFLLFLSLTRRPASGYILCLYIHLQQGRSWSSAQEESRSLVHTCCCGGEKKGNTFHAKNGRAEEKKNAVLPPLHPSGCDLHCKNITCFSTAGPSVL